MLRYKGGGWLVGVPARDLSDEDLAHLAASTGLNDETVARLKADGLSDADVALLQAEVTLSAERIAASGLYEAVASQARPSAPAVPASAAAGPAAAVSAPTQEEEVSNAS